MRKIHILIAITVIPNPDNKPTVDHINGDRSDNRVENLRWATYSENSRNRKKLENVSSDYIGVCWDESRYKWKASIHINGKTINIGRYDSEVEAAKAFDREACKRNSVFTKLNFPDDESDD